MSAATPLIVQQAEAEQLLARIDVLQAMRQLFLDLAAGQALQPAQQLVEFPAGRGDFINYLGVLAQEQVYGVKTSPYIVREQGPLVTAWTLLMSMQTGQPLLLCDAARLTTARTAATTAVAVDALAPAEAGRLALIGSGPVAHAHLQYVKGLRDWQGVRVHSPSLDERRLQSLRAIDPRAEAAGSLEEALDEADVILLCTSSARAVIDPRQLKRPALVTSISTNAPRAHEVPAESLAAMDVYCDYRHTTPGSAGEMLIAAEQHGWSPEAIRGDLAELLSGQAPRPEYRRPARPQTPVAEALELMDENDRRYLIVVDDQGKGLGYVRRKDLRRQEGTCAPFVTPFRVTASHDEHLRILLSRMYEFNSSWLPVLDPDQQFLGEVTQESIADYLSSGRSRGGKGLIVSPAEQVGA
ncbi:TPA: CBS domain-containing protein [Pseudomonas aeruginosa]